MYPCKLKIALFSTDRCLEETVRGVEVVEPFIYDIVTREWMDSQLVAESSLVIWDLEDRCWPGTLSAMCKGRAKIVFCARHEELLVYRQADRNAADDLWERPYAYPVVQHRLLRLLERMKLERELYLSQMQIETAINNTPDMVWFKTLDGIHVKVNNAFCAVVGKAREDVTGKDHCEIWGVSRDDPNSGESDCRETEAAVIRAGHMLQFTENVKSPHGKRQFITYKSPLYDVDGTVLGTVGFGHDITDLANMSTELEILLRSMPYAILLRDTKDVILNVNPKFTEYFGVNEDQVVGKAYEQWSTQAFFEERTVNNEGFIEANVRSDGKKGKSLEIHEDTIYDIFENAVGKICIFRDVTMERQLEAEILRNSNTDFMTKLYNRRCLYQYVRNNCQGHDKTVSILYVDLDRFKLINDTYGHKVGDDALILTAEIMRECFPGDFVARIGGDEFLILKIGGIELAQVEKEAQHLLDRLQEAFNAAECLRELSASIGITQNYGQASNIDVLIQHSDAALYRAKQLGRSRYCVYHADQAQGCISEGKG